MKKDSIYNLIIAILLIIIIYLLLSRKDKVESFVNTDIVSSDDIYDEFYSKIYDKLFSAPYKIEFEVNDLDESILSKMEKDKVKILDIGCGSGQHIKLLSDRDYNVIGLDNSNEMLKVAKKNNPNVRFILGNALDKKQFGAKKFNVISCYYFTVYYFKDLRKFLENVSFWLKEDGIFVVHIVNKDKFDPILEPASPFPAFSLQKYTKGRVMKSDVVFNNFEYQSEFKIVNSNKANFIEKFKFRKKNKTRKQIHEFYMFNIKQFIRISKDYSLNLIGRTDLVNCGYEYQYLFYFRKETE
tara:strand:+ start:1314 stop:2207 length:894 start_codon:yes stop_codon:yes gene_type:complete